MYIGGFGGNYKMRWYDLDPDVSMAISMIECASLDDQIEYSKFIISQVKTKDLNYEYIKNITTMNKYHQRWYDRNEVTSTAFAYLKTTTKELQKEISRSILDIMKKENLVK